MADEPSSLQPDHPFAAEDRVAADGRVADAGGTTSIPADLQSHHAAAGGCGSTSSHVVDNTADTDSDRGLHRPRSDVAYNGEYTG